MVNVIEIRRRWVAVNECTSGADSAIFGEGKHYGKFEANRRDAGSLGITSRKFCKFSYIGATWGPFDPLKFGNFGWFLGQLETKYGHISLCSAGSAPAYINYVVCVRASDCFVNYVQLLLLLLLLLLFATGSCWCTQCVNAASTLAL